MKLPIRGCGVRAQLVDKVRLAFYLAMVVAIAAIATLASEPAVRTGASIGGAVGLAMHWFKTRKCRMSLPTDERLGEVRQALAKMRYVEFGSHDHYRLDLPRWMFFDHQDILIDRRAGGVDIVGPKYILRLIRNRLSDPGPEKLLG